MIAVNLLKEFAFFKDFSSDQLKKLSSVATKESHMAGEHMYQKGDAARSLFLIKKVRLSCLWKVTWAQASRPCQLL
jgi:hypothetical protein